MIKTDDMVKVLVKEILDLNNKLLFEHQDNMKKMNILYSPYKDTTTVHQLLGNDEIIKSVEESMSAFEPIKHRLNVFNKIFKIIISVRDLNEGKKK